MRAWALLLLLCAIACGSEPDPLLEVGGYRLELSSVIGRSAGPRLTLEGDGSFVGHDYETLWDCDGRFTAAEHAALTDALNVAAVLSRDDNPQQCADHSKYDFRIEALSGTAAGRQNTFRYEVCTSSVPALDAVLGHAFAPVQAVQATGTCMGCAPETAERACYEERPYGARRVCERGTARDCDGALDDLVIDCGREFLQCDATLGWLPGARWALVEPHLWRRVDEGGELRIMLAWSLEVEKRDATRTRRAI